MGRRRRKGGIDNDVQVGRFVLLSFAVGCCFFFGWGFGDGGWVGVALPSPCCSLSFLLSFFFLLDIRQLSPSPRPLPLLV